MSESTIPSNLAEGNTSYPLFFIKFFVSSFILPPYSFVGWGTVGVIVYVMNRLRYRHCISNVTMKNKTVIVTGANKGIGLETARDLVRRGATVILACRNIIRANAARDDILSTDEGKVEVGQVDLAYMASVRKFAKTIQNRKIDVLIHNAAVLDLPREMTDEGLELTVATNYLGPFLLTHLLMPNLQAGAGGRVVNLTSMGNVWIKNTKELDIENDMKFEFDRPLKTMEIYVVTKFLNIVFSNELDRKIRGSGVTTNAVHPGIVNTDIYINFTANVWYGFFIKLWVAAYSKNSAEGAQTSIHVAVSEELNGVSGKYFVDCKEATPNKLTQDEGLAKKVWELSERLVQLQPHERTI